MLSVALGFTLLFYPLQSFAILNILSDSSIRVQLNYPDSVVRGNQFTINALFDNNLSSTPLQNISLTYTVQNEIFQASNNQTILIDSLAGDGSFGQTSRFTTLTDVPEGEYYINAKLLYYRDSGISGIQREIIQESLKIHVGERSQIRLTIHIPEAVFPEDSFPVKLDLTNLGELARNITVTIIPPQDLEFRGQTKHNIGDLRRDQTISLVSQIQTPNDISQEYRAPFQVKLSYTDELGQEIEDSRTESILVRQRTFFEIGSPNGTWIGGLFIPYSVSIGAFIGIPSTLYTIFRWLRKRSQKSAKT